MINWQQFTHRSLYRSRGYRSITLLCHSGFSIFDAFARRADNGSVFAEVPR